MKILMVALGIYHAKGGIEKFNQRVLRVLSHLVDSGSVEKVTVISLWDHQNELEQHFPNINMLGFSRSKLRTFMTFIREILSQHYDRILLDHVLLYPLLLISALISRKSKTIICVYGYEVWDKPSMIKKWVVTHLADKIISISDFTTRKMLETYGIINEKFSTLPPAINLKRLFTRQTADDSHCIFRLLSVSRLSTAARYKNIDKVILALPDVIKSFPMARYTIVGDGDLKTELEELSKSLGLEAVVTFTGGVSEQVLCENYQASDLFILPSDEEGFGIVYLEAWHYHLPVIASKYGAAPEVVRDGLDGYCVKPTPAEITIAITDLLSNRDRAREMGESGYLRMKTHFTHEQFETRLSQILLDQVRS